MHQAQVLPKEQTDVWKHEAKPRKEATLKYPWSHEKKYISLRTRGWVRQEGFVLVFGGAIRDRALAARGLGRGCGLPAPQRSALTAPWQLPGSICSSSRSCSVHSQDCISSKKLLSLLGAVQLLQTCVPTLWPLLCTCVAHVATSALNACVADGVRGHSAPFPAHTWEVCEDHGSSHIHIGGSQRTTGLRAVHEAPSAAAAREVQTGSAETRWGETLLSPPETWARHRLGGGSGWAGTNRPSPLWTGWGGCRGG